MPFATHYSRNGRRPNVVKCLNTAARVLVAFCLLAFGAVARSAPATTETNSPAARAESEFEARREAYETRGTNFDACWQFARACFDWAEFSTNDFQRAKVAEIGIKASRDAIARNAGGVEGHYYLGMNLGQLAKTRGLSALRLVDQMEAEFKLAQRLDEKFDFAGPDRNLGLLYRDVPSIGSIGSRSKAKTHLLRAVELAPEFPENRLNLAETRVSWKDFDGARQQLNALETSLAQARKLFSGAAWETAWTDWEQRLAKLRRQLGNAVKSATSPKGMP